MRFSESYLVSRLVSKPHVQSMSLLIFCTFASLLCDISLLIVFIVEIVPLLYCRQSHLSMIGCVSKFSYIQANLKVLILCLIWPDCLAQKINFEFD
uniref:NADH dehydrogenase subunit 4L n=1 Tax=Panagrolaimus sp. JU765 TaxID=591449 RepID=A0AC34R4V7_9BILA